MTAGVAIGVTVGEDGALEFRHAQAMTPLDHHRAVVTGLRAGPLAPLRFGMTMDADALGENDAALRRVIALSPDHIEIGLRITTVDGDGRTLGGRGWLRRAAARNQASLALAERLASVPGVAMVRDLGADGSVRRFALCAPRSGAAGVAAALPAIEGFTADVSGPWPLYSFTPAGARP
jgi:hypothetical protein